MFRTLCLLLSLLLVCPPAFAADGTTLVKIQGNLSRSLDLVTVLSNFTYTSTENWTDGTGANQYQVVFSDERTTDSTGEELDLAGVLKDPFNLTLTFTAVKVISIEASSSNTNNTILIGGTHPVTGIFADTSDAIIVRPGGTLTIVAPDTTGYAITATSADDLKVYSSGTGNVKYKIVILGEGSGS